MTGGQENSASCLSLADDVAGRRGGQNAVLADQELLDSVSRTNLSDQLDYLWVPVSAIAADDQGRS